MKKELKKRLTQYIILNRRIYGLQIARNLSLNE